MSIHFYDAANPENIPSGVFAAVAINGDFAWPEEDIRRMARVFRYSVEREPGFARLARGLDVESGAADLTDIVPFIKVRRERYDDATVYVDRSNWEEAKARVAHAGLAQPFYWIPTLDGTQNVPGSWAVQYQGGIHSAFDLSVLHGKNNFVRS